MSDNNFEYVYNGDVVIWDYINRARQEIEKLANELREHIGAGNNAHPIATSSNNGMMSSEQFKTMIGLQSRIDKLRDIITASSLPKGSIVWWPREISEIPSGWRLCDGSNSTVDMKNRIAIGSSSIKNASDSSSGISISAGNVTSYPQYYGMVCIEKTTSETVNLSTAKSELLPYKDQLAKVGIIV